MKCSVLKAQERKSKRDKMDEEGRKSKKANTATHAEKEEHTSPPTCLGRIGRKCHFQKIVN